MKREKTLFVVERIKPNWFGAKCRMLLRDQVHGREIYDKTQKTDRVVDVRLHLAFDYQPTTVVYFYLHENMKI